MSRSDVTSREAGRLCADQMGAEGPAAGLSTRSNTTTAKALSGLR